MTIPSTRPDKLSLGDLAVGLTGTSDVCAIPPLSIKASAILCCRHRSPAGIARFLAAATQHFWTR